MEFYPIIRFLEQLKKSSLKNQIQWYLQENGLFVEIKSRYRKLEFCFYLDGFVTVELKERKFFLWWKRRRLLELFWSDALELIAKLR